MSIWTLAFWRAAGERAVKTFAQTLAALLTAAGTGILDTAWETSASIAGMAAVISLLTSIGSDLLTGGSGPSLTNAEVVTDAPVEQRGETGIVTVLAVVALVLLILVLTGVVR